MSYADPAPIPHTRYPRFDTRTNTTIEQVWYDDGSEEVILFGPIDDITELL